jgi:hypothetical protein
MANQEIQLAENFALHTDENMFITGNAGTGKTTLLKKIADSEVKNTLVAAPTGVAAINAGGVTLHSLFQLPVTSFIPADDACNPSLFTNRYMLLRHLKLSKEKITLLRELEQLIIDEASMVRSDVLDAVDFVLKSVRKNKFPFGGVQVVMIGDLYQLPPVVKDHEWETLQQFYQSPYFFDSLIWQDAHPVHIELTEIFRQRDERFIRLLNNIRNREPGEDDFRLLAERFRPNEEPGGTFILLTTHNYKADQVNLEKLNKTEGKPFSFAASIEGEFPEHMFPCEKVLTLKRGARIMFIKNDTLAGQYYNGLTGTVSHLTEKELHVTTDDGRELNVKKHTWENIKYYTHADSGRISKEPVGSFRQYPLRLAWAVTIHKSQGLTFDNVMIDAGKSFAPGQVYVALSRCRSLEGIVLLSKITSEVLFSDSRVLDFSSHTKSNTSLNVRLEASRQAYGIRRLSLIFRFEKLKNAIGLWEESFKETGFSGKEKAEELLEKLNQQIRALDDISYKFNKQLEQLIPLALVNPEHHHLLVERCAKAIGYLTGELYHKFLIPLNEYIHSMAYKTRVKKHVNAAMELSQSVWQNIHRLYQAQFNGAVLYTGEKLFRHEALAVPESSATKKKKVKGDSVMDTLALFQQKKTLDEIAQIRSLARSTVKGHFADLIKKNKVDIHEVLSHDTISIIRNAIKKSGSTRLGDVRNFLPEGFDLNEVRMVVNWMEAGKLFRA